MKVRINRADLWGNYRDGFDNNGNYEIGAYETDQDLESTELSPKVINKIAREWFAGRSFPLTENGGNFIGQNSKVISVEWQSDYSHDDTPTAIYDVFYRGQYIGEIVITGDKKLAPTS